jgi:hypothetical protein
MSTFAVERRPLQERTEHFGRVILKIILPEYLFRENGTEGK